MCKTILDFFTYSAHVPTDNKEITKTKHNFIVNKIYFKQNHENISKYKNFVFELAQSHLSMRMKQLKN